MEPRQVARRIIKRKLGSVPNVTERRTKSGRTFWIRERMMVEAKIQKKEIQDKYLTAKINDSLRLHNVEDQNYAKHQALMKLPKLSGNAKEWPRFKQIYDETTVEGGYTNLENIARLKEALVGEAARSVSNLMIGAANIPKVIQRLVDTFGKPEIVYKQLLDDLTRTLNSTRVKTIRISEDLDSVVTNVDEDAGIL